MLVVVATRAVACSLQTDAQAMTAMGQSRHIRQVLGMSGSPSIAAEKADMAMDRLADLTGRAFQLCPGILHVYLLRNGKRVVHINAEISDGALDLGVAK